MIPAVSKLEWAEVWRPYSHLNEALNSGVGPLSEVRKIRHKLENLLRLECRDVTIGVGQIPIGTDNEQQRSAAHNNVR